jgi:hypothetical protein
MKRKVPDCQLSDENKLIVKTIKSWDTTELRSFWKSIPVELKLEILSYLPENYLWTLKEQYPIPYYRQTAATCCPENEFRILKEASEGYVFRFMRELRIEKQPVFQSITPHVFPMLDILGIMVDSGDFRELPGHHSLRILKICGPCIDLSFLTLTKFPNLKVLALYSGWPMLTSLPVLDITRLSIFCLTVGGIETLTDAKLPKLRELEIDKKELDCFNLPAHNGLKNLNCQWCEKVLNIKYLKKKFPNLKQLKIRKGVDFKSLEMESVEVVIKI